MDMVMIRPLFLIFIIIALLQPSFEYVVPLAFFIYKENLLRTKTLIA